MLSWQIHPGQPTLDSRQVHVWRIPLQLSGFQLAHLHKLLSDEETQRARRFYFERDRVSYVASHGALRLILSGYLGCQAKEINFNLSPYGKPSVAGRAGSLEFNLSHAYELALVGISLERMIGVDIEHLRPELADEQIARRYFSELEVTTFLSLPPMERQAAFFTCWTRKEAYIKARGEGLSHRLDQFDVSLKPGEPAKLLATRPDPQEVRRWQLRALEPGPGYYGAVVAAGQDWQLSCWDWQPLD